MEKFPYSPKVGPEPFLLRLSARPDRPQRQLAVGSSRRDHRSWAGFSFLAKGTRTSFRLDAFRAMGYTF